MLSNKTKLERINKKLEILGLKLRFDCYDLKTLTPKLYKNDSYSMNNAVYKLYGIQIGVREVGFNRVKFEVIDIHGVDGSKQSGDWWKLYVNKVKEIDTLLSYCNNLSLEVPPYKG